MLRAVGTRDEHGTIGIEHTPDAQLAQFGVHAAELIRDGIFGVSVALVGNTITHNPLSEIAGVPKLVPPDHQMIQIARNIGISFGAK